MHGKIDQATDKVKYLLVDHVRKDLRTLKLSRHQLRMVVAYLTGHAPVKKHLNMMGLFDSDADLRFCKMETEAVTILFAAAKPWLANAIISLGSSL